MAHNAFIRPGGVWTGNAAVATTEIAALDLAQFQSLNGDLGGTWAPLAVITIGGQGVTVAGPLQATNVQRAIFGSGSVLTVPDTCTTTIALGAGSSLTTESGAAVNFDSFTCETFAQFNGAVQIGGQFSRGSASRAVRRFTSTHNGNASISSASTDQHIFFLDDSANRTCVIQTTTHPGIVGEDLEVVLVGFNGEAVTINDELGNNLAVLNAPHTTGNDAGRCSVRFSFVTVPSLGGQWKVTDRSGLVSLGTAG